MKMTVYAYLKKKLVKSASVILCLKLPRVLKFTLAGKYLSHIYVVCGVSRTKTRV